MDERSARGRSAAGDRAANWTRRLNSASKAAQSLGRALSARPPCSSLPDLPLQRRQRLALVLRALDACNEDRNYRAIAEGLFGKDRIPERAWKTHDLRNRTIRLVQRGLALMRGGYRELLRPKTQGEITPFGGYPKIQRSIFGIPLRRAASP